MAFTRIKDSDLAGKGVKDQSTVPGLSAEEMKASVEQIVREVAIPGVNRLAEELEADSAAGSLGSEIPAGDGTTELPEDTPKNVGGVAAAIMKLLAGFIARRDNPHGVTASQVGAYTKKETDDAIDQKVQAIGAADMSKAEFATNGEYGVVDKAKAADTASAANDGVKVYSHTRSGTVNELTGTGPNGRALMTADVQESDTWTVNGQPVTAYMGTEDATASMAGQAYTGKWVTFVLEGETLNFKGGGGKVTAEGLSADVILADKTVTIKQGAKVVQQVTGTVQSAFELVHNSASRSTCTFQKSYRQVVVFGDDTQGNDGSYITITWNLASGTYKTITNIGGSPGKAAVQVGVGYDVKPGDTVAFNSKMNNGHAIVVGVPE